jgi:hypothetical protein
MSEGSRPEARGSLSLWNHASFLSRATESWVIPLLWRGKQQNLTFKDFGVASDDLSSANFALFKKQHARSLTNVVRMFWKDIVQSIVWGVFVVGLQLFQVYFVFQSLLGFLMDPSQQEFHFGWILAFLLAMTLGSIALSSNMFRRIRCKITVRLGVSHNSEDF